ncbi:cytochrome P450 [Streptomyces rubradiris]|uniref:Cytochrome P450 n=1 Tax=Streptomyces rubradiris TaxID=285531 RepID=A0ABQ3RL50_STRRR|nr:cytochrome P450 [Streptomyces rubradiris]GHH10595.1 cytochrome P450 [Streptomyces rubradiris]GHI56599.1 cytochrome P450 [Streptomyces rubradiris]
MSQKLVQFPILKEPACPFDPPSAMRALDDPVQVRLWDGSTPWLVTGYDLGRRLLVDPRVSADSTRPGYPHFDLGSRERRKDGRSFVAMDDPEHARQRRMVASPFAIRPIEALRGDVTDIVNGLIDDLLAGPNPTDLVSRFAFPTSTQVICRMLGVPYTDHEFFQEQSTLMLHRDSSPEMVVNAQEALRGYLRELIDRQMKEPADGLISSVIETQVRTGALSPEQLSYISMTLLVAGLETTGNMIALGTLALLRNPDQLALLRETDDQELVNRAVDELIRYLNISHSGRRRVALEDIPLGDITIRAGEGIILASELANRDPEHFPDPDRLDITRDAAHHLAFGFGPHHCLGRPLATLELQVVYGTLYRRVPTLRLAIDFADVAFKYDGVAYGVRELPVAW